MREVDWEGIFREAWEAWEPAPGEEDLTGMRRSGAQLGETLVALVEEGLPHGDKATLDHLYDLLYASKDTPLTEEEVYALKFLALGSTLVLRDMLAKGPLVEAAGLLGHVAMMAYKIGLHRGPGG